MGLQFTSLRRLLRRGNAHTATNRDDPRAAGPKWSESVFWSVPVVRSVLMCVGTSRPSRLNASADDITSNYYCNYYCYIINIQYSSRSRAAALGKSRLEPTACRPVARIGLFSGTVLNVRKDIFVRMHRKSSAILVRF